MGFQLPCRRDVQTFFIKGTDMDVRLWLAVLATLTACGSEKDDRDEGGGPATGGTDVCSYDDTNEPATALRFLTNTSRYGELQPEIQAQLSRTLPAGIKVDLVDKRVSGSAEHYDYRYVAGGIPLCGAMSHVHVVRGQVIYRDELATGSLDGKAWSDVSSLVFDDPMSIARRGAGELGIDPAKVRLTSAERCWLVDAGAPAAAYEMAAIIGDRPYKIVGNVDRLTKVSPAWFDVTGEGQTYEKNSVDGVLKSYPLPDLDESTSQLVSRRFKTLVASDATPAEFEDRKYVVEPSDPRFTEIAMFTNVERMASWFTLPEHDYKLGCVPIEVEPHAVFKSPYSDETSVNNGAYIPPEATKTGYPLIRMGDGDGTLLRNLGTDFDTVAHELGHHIIYQRIKDQKGEAGVLHEGLADYFVFAATGDACLGESVCPAGSDICTVESQCLRSGQTDLRYDSDSLPPDAHRRSQLISGYLWDVGSKPELGHAQVAKTLIKAIDYLGRAPGYLDLIKALMDADLELTTGANGCAFLDGAKARGMTELVADLSCETK